MYRGGENRRGKRGKNDVLFDIIRAKYNKWQAEMSMAQRQPTITNLCTLPHAGVRLGGTSFLLSSMSSDASASSSFSIHSPSYSCSFD